LGLRISSGSGFKRGAGWLLHLPVFLKRGGRGAHREKSDLLPFFSGFFAPLSFKF
jgi:hypothetical protein